MAHFEDFAKALETSLRRQIESEILEGNPAFSPLKKPAEVLGSDEPARSFAWILGQKPSVQTQNSDSGRAHRAYGVRPRPPRPHALNFRQLQAKNLFARYGAHLSEAFRKTEVKTAWRKVAKQTHPDQGGDAGVFREARGAYLELLTVFKS